MLQLCVFCFYFYSINYNNQGFNLMDHYNSQYRNFNSDKKDTEEGCAPSYILSTKDYNFYALHFLKAQVWKWH